MMEDQDASTGSRKVRKDARDSARILRSQDEARGIVHNPVQIPHNPDGEGKAIFEASNPTVNEATSITPQEPTQPSK